MKASILHGSLGLLMATGLLLLVGGCGHSGKVALAENGELTFTSLDGSDQTLKVAPESKITLDGQPAELEDLDEGDSVSVLVDEREGERVATNVRAQSKEKQAEREVPMERSPAEPTDDPSPHTEEPEPIPPIEAGGPIETPDHNTSKLSPGEADKAESPTDDTQIDGEAAEQGDPTDDTSGIEAVGEDAVEHTGKIASIEEGVLMLDTDATGHTFVMDENTSVTIDGQPADVADLEIGFSATVLAERKGDRMVAMAIDAVSAQ